MLPGACHDLQVKSVKIRSILILLYRQVTRLQPELISTEKCSTTPKKSCQLLSDFEDSISGTNEKPLIKRFCLVIKQDNATKNLNTDLNPNDKIGNSIEQFSPSLVLDRARMLKSGEFSRGPNKITEEHGKDSFTSNKVMKDLEASSSDYHLKFGPDHSEIDQEENLLGDENETTLNALLLMEETTMPSIKGPAGLMMYDSVTKENIYRETTTKESTTTYSSMDRESSDESSEKSSEESKKSSEDETVTEVSVGYSESSSEERHILSFLPNSTAASK